MVKHIIEISKDYFLYQYPDFASLSYNEQQRLINKTYAQISEASKNDKLMTILIPSEYMRIVTVEENDCLEIQLPEFNIGPVIMQKEYGNLQLDRREKDVLIIWNIKGSTVINDQVIHIERNKIPELIDHLLNELKP